MCTSPSTPGRISTNAPNVTTFVTLPSTMSPSLYDSSTCCHGSACVCLRPSEMRWRSRSMSSTLTCTVCPISSTSDGWLTCDHESSEMWMRPSMPSRSTNAPKSTMLEIWPSTTLPGCRRSRICCRCSLRSSSSTARRESTTLLRERLSSMTLQRSSWPRHSSRSCTRRLSTSEAGALLGEDEPALGVLLRQHERVDLVAQGYLVGRVDRAADRQLGDRDDALRLVADVHENLVLVHAHDGAVDDFALVDFREGGLVVRDELPVRTLDPDAGLLLHQIVDSQNDREV